MQTQAELEALVGELRSEGSFALDTESNSFHAYFERVCLVQLSTRETDFVVDPFCVDIRPLGELFENSKIEKVLHAADYDIRSLKRDFGFNFTNLFDTMIAAKILGRREVGLAALVKAHFGVQLAKVHQRSDWGRRPLTPDQLIYAHTDTHFLLPLRDMLSNELAHAGRSEEAIKLFRKQAMCEPRPKKFDTKGYQKITGFRALEPKERAIARALYLLREDCARASNRPPFKIYGDDVILTLARRQPRDCVELLQVKGLGLSTVRRNGEAIVSAIANAISMHAA